MKFYHMMRVLMDTDPPNPVPGGGGGPPVPEKTFTQAELNAILAEEKKKLQEKSAETIANLKNLERTANLTAQERDDLKTRIKAMEESLLTKEEKSKKELEETHKAFQDQLKESRLGEDRWRGLYTNSSVENSLTAAASEEKAFNPAQIHALLSSRTVLEEERDTVGKLTGKFVVQVHDTVVAEDGSVKSVKVSVKDAVKKLKESKEHANLFYSDKQGGTGGVLRSVPGGSGAPKLSAIQKIAAGLRGQ